MHEIQSLSTKNQTTYRFGTGCDAHRRGLNERGRQSGRAQQQNSEHLKILISTQLQGVLEATKATRFTRSMQHHIFLSELAVGCFCRHPFLPFSKRTSPKPVEPELPHPCCGPKLPSSHGFLPDTNVQGTTVNAINPAPVDR